MHLPPFHLSQQPGPFNQGLHLCDLANNNCITDNELPLGEAYDFSTSLFSPPLHSHARHGLTMVTYQFFSSSLGPWVTLNSWVELSV